jgi:hypothetical protein
MIHHLWQPAADPPAFLAEKLASGSVSQNIKGGADSLKNMYNLEAVKI